MHPGQDLGPNLRSFDHIVCLHRAASDRQHPDEQQEDDAESMYVLCLKC
jgi:hypothetical protein